MLVITAWMGRLGNRIFQLSNIIDIALMYHHDISFSGLQLYLFDLKIIENYFKKYTNNQRILDHNNFFYRDKLPVSKETWKKNAEERNNILKKAFLLKNIEKLPENDLVIHIRSGDIFSSRPHGKYVPPPLSYYVTQIEKK